MFVSLMLFGAGEKARLHFHTPLSYLVCAPVLCSSPYLHIRPHIFLSHPVVPIPALSSLCIPTSLTSRGRGSATATLPGKDHTSPEQGPVVSRVKKRTVSIRHPSPSPHFTLKMMPTPEVIYFLLKLIVTNTVIFMGTPPSEP